MRADTIYCYCLSQCVTKEAFQNHCMLQITRARLTACDVGVFYEKNITTLENMPTPFFQEPLKFIAHGCIFERLRQYSECKPRGMRPIKPLTDCYLFIQYHQACPSLVHHPRMLTPTIIHTDIQISALAMAILNTQGTSTYKVLTQRVLKWHFQEHDICFPECLQHNSKPLHHSSGHQ